MRTEQAPEVARAQAGDPLMARARSVLVLVDYQERLMPAIADSSAVIARAALLGRVAAQLGVPVVATAQNPDRLGPNVPVIAQSCGTVLTKMSFGACADGLTAHLPDGLREVVIAGCEAHVCLLQTALPLIETGYRVWVVADASGSRRDSDHALAMARLRQAGATIVSSEMVAFEWLRTCEDADFKAVSALIKAG